MRAGDGNIFTHTHQELRDTATGLAPVLINWHFSSPHQSGQAENTRFQFRNMNLSRFVSIGNIRPVSWNVNKRFTDHCKLKLVCFAHPTYSGRMLEYLWIDLLSLLYFKVPQFIRNIIACFK